MSQQQQQQRRRGNAADAAGIVMNAFPLPPVHHKKIGIVVLFAWMIASCSMNAVYLVLSPKDVRDSKQYELLYYLTVDKALIAIRMVMAASSLNNNRAEPTVWYVVAADLAVLATMFINVALLAVAFVSFPMPANDFFGTVYAINLAEMCLMSAAWVVTMLLHWRATRCCRSNEAVYGQVQ